MSWNNAFLKFDQVGFQELLFVGVNYFSIFRFIKWLILLDFLPYCMNFIQQVTHLELHPTGTIIYIHKNWQSKLKIIMDAMISSDFPSKIKMELWLPLTGKEK